MKDKFGIIYCENLRREVESSIPVDIRDDVRLQAYSRHCLPFPTENVSTDDAYYALASECHTVCLFGCGCPLVIKPPSDIEESSVFNVYRGADIFLPAATVAQLYRQGAYVINAGWLQGWKEGLAFHFSDLEIARKMISESMEEVVLLDSGLYPGIEKTLQDFSEFLGIPARVVEVGLGHLEMIIKDQYQIWKLSQQRRVYERLYKESNKKSADYAMISDMLSIIVRLQDEQTIIHKVNEMYTLLMSPGKVSFITNPIMDKGSASEWSCTLQAYGIQDESPLHNLDYKVNHEKNGFLHMVRFQEEILGIIHVENLALPAFLTDYLNASMFIVSVFALALHNASIFRILKQTISDLDSEIASRRQAQESLQVSNKKLNLLSSITRHDLNNHLAVQIGYLELLDRSEFNQTDARYLDNIKKSTEKMASMIRFTKDYQEIGVRSPQWHKVCQVVNEAVTKLNLEGKQFMNDLSPDLEVYSDPMIVKVFYNLIDNSLRYAGKSTYIRFYSQFENDQLQIICEDDGHGIEDDQKINIFNRGVGKNTGLGLFLSKEILDITGLAICENGRFGEGARFKITVPSSAFRICGNNHSILQ